MLCALHEDNLLVLLYVCEVALIIVKNSRVVFFCFSEISLYICNILDYSNINQS